MRNNKNEKQQIQINIHNVHGDSKQDILHNLSLRKTEKKTERNSKRERESREYDDDDG
jgi:predicted RNA-binding protein with RPS1 domain